MTLKMIASLNFHHREQIVDESLMRIQPRIFAHCTRRMMCIPSTYYSSILRAREVGIRETKNVGKISPGWTVDWHKNRRRKTINLHKNGE